MASKLTELQLEKVTDFLRFESFCCDLMLRCGYPSLEPLGGYKDRGRDAIHVGKDNSTTTIFFFATRKDWEKKLYEDLDKVKKHGHKCDEIVYVTNREIGAGDRDRLIQAAYEKYSWKLEVFPLKRIAMLVDKHLELKQLHPEIFYFEGQTQYNLEQPLDTKAYAIETIGAFERWREEYTPLRIEQVEFELFAVNLDDRNNNNIPILELPSVVSIAALLGESGADKTTTLRKLIAEASYKLKNGESTMVPVYIQLRNWTSETPIRHLIQNEFAKVKASENAVGRLLEEGQCLILVDGLNELPPNSEQHNLAGRDIRNFYKQYSSNKFLFTCRTTDFDPGLINVLDDSHPPCFETQRLSREQIIEYAHRVFHKEPQKADAFLKALGIDNINIWENKNAFLRLVRIPLFLQMTIREYERSGKFPANKGAMLHSFVNRLIQRDRTFHKISPEAKRAVLSGLAYSGVEAGRYMSLPKPLIQQIAAQVLQNLRNAAAISQEAIVSDVLTEVLSTNFLTTRRSVNEGVIPSDWDVAEWLHQVILDYFLAQEIINVMVGLEGAEKVSRLSSQMATYPNVFSQPCQMALGILDIDSRKLLYEKIVTSSLELARQALAGISEEHAEELVLHVVKKITDESVWDKHSLTTISSFIPSASIVNRLSSTFKQNADTEERRTLAHTICNIAIEFQGSYAAKRALDVCEAWHKNKDDEVSFYAAKALWGRDKGAASATLKRLSQSSSLEVRQMVRTLATQLGIV